MTSVVQAADRDERVPEGKSVMVTLDASGDSKLIWDGDVPTEVEAARAQFDTLKSKGYVAYSVTRKGDKGSVIHEFDPTAEKIILAPATRGG